MAYVVWGVDLFSSVEVSLGVEDLLELPTSPRAPDAPVPYSLPQTSKLLLLSHTRSRGAATAIVRKLRGWSYFREFTFHALG